ncbi:MAG: hypothetical protein NWE87_06905 [Candidatus Bathyarchaeota archaeon]|nr:hypothetical protein [Candidatus Bathyarchaeota archaeon]
MVAEAVTHYFENRGEQNTDKTLELAKVRALERNVKQVVVASTRGITGVKAAEAFKDTGIEVIIVTHQTGHIGAGVQQLTDENRKKLESLDITIVTGSDALEGGVGLGITRRQTTDATRPTPETQGMASLIRRMNPTIPPVVRIVASVLRLFCQGMKVAVEVTLMAADAGVIPVDHAIVAIAGTGRGADTAIVIQPANTTNFLDLDIHEIIAKPYTTRSR